MQRRDHAHPPLPNGLLLHSAFYLRLGREPRRASLPSVLDDQGRFLDSGGVMLARSELEGRSLEASECLGGRGLRVVDAADRDPAARERHRVPRAARRKLRLRWQGQRCLGEDHGRPSYLLLNDRLIERTPAGPGSFTYKAGVGSGVSNPRAAFRARYVPFVMDFARVAASERGPTRGWWLCGG